LADAEARKFIKGVAWHLYAGEIEAMSELAKKHTTIKTYFTEYWVGAGSEFAEGLRWHVENILIGASRNGAQAILEWNLAGDPNHGPHTEEGAISASARSPSDLQQLRVICPITSSPIYRVLSAPGL
jgi:glucosylceramidase